MEAPTAEIEPAADRAVARAHGLTDKEWDRILELLGRPPNQTELGIFSAMWNEHCSYKSSRVWLRQLPTTGDRVIHGPGENAGVVDLGHGQAVAFKIESHNHPTYIEPYQGAATGVGGILRDVFTMGARPVAALNALWFGSPTHPATRRLLAGAVAGIGGYGNSFGVPTVGGQLGFDPSYNGNCLVNAFVAGVVDTDAVFTAQAAGVDRPVVYLGARTGRDGVGGASMASTVFGTEVDSKRPTVQIGDPFTGKRLCEACLELFRTGAVVAIQDMGAAGLTCSSAEMAASGGLGIELNLDAVPCRESGMSAYEMMLSESQERMLMVLHPEHETAARAIFEKWDLEFAVIGRLIAEDRLRVLRHGNLHADLPLQVLTAAAPEYTRPHTATPPRSAATVADCDSPIQSLRALIRSPTLASRRWVWEQYDHMVMADTVIRPGADAAVVRIHGTERGLALTLDCNPHYCHADPESGGQQAVAEACRNLRAVGAQPLAITNCLNFGSPERPGIMGQFVGCVEGMSAASRALGVPVVSGNVSFYNETSDTAILPTPTIGAVGLLERLDQVIHPEIGAEEAELILLGTTRGHLCVSLYARELAQQVDGPPPPVDLEAELATGQLVGELNALGLIRACHDLSDGGLAVAAAEMALQGNRGLALAAPPTNMRISEWYFGEDQGRYLIVATPSDYDRIMELAGISGIPAARVGAVTDRDAIELGGEAMPLTELRHLHGEFLQQYMKSP